MKIDVSEEGMMRISEIFEPIIIKAEKDSFVVSQRDGVLELYKNPAAVWDMSIAEMHARGEVSRRLLNCLYVAGIKTFQDLRRVNITVLRETRGFGHKLQNEVRDLLISKQKK